MTAENVLRISPEKKESAEHKFIFSGDVVRTGGEHPLATNAGHPRTGRRTRGRMMKGGGRVGELLPKRMRLETILVPTHGEVCVVSTWSDNYVNRSCDGRNSVCK